MCAHEVRRLLDLDEALKSDGVHVKYMFQWPFVNPPVNSGIMCSAPNLYTRGISCQS